MFQLDADNSLVDMNVNKVPELSDDWLSEDDKLLRQAARIQQQRNANLLPSEPGVAPPGSIMQPDDDSDYDDMSVLLPRDDDDLDSDSEDEGSRPAKTKTKTKVKPTVTISAKRERRNQRRNRKFYSPEYVNACLEKQRSRDEANHALLVKTGDLFLREMETFLDSPSDRQTAFFVALHQVRTDDDGLLDSVHPMAFATKANSDDTPTLFEAMRSPDSEGFYQAMVEEIELLENDFEAWEVVPRSVPIEKGKSILGTTWAFKRKRYPDGRVRKLKARLCIRGDQQIEGVDFFDTYAPVVGWSTVRLLMVLAVVLGLMSVQVDYTNAFIQAPIDDEVYCEMPQMFRAEGYVIRLKRNVYGLRQAPLNFFLLLKQALEQRGFVQSVNDPCLFATEEGVICLCYVDDCIWYAKDKDLIYKIIKDLQEPANPEHLPMKLKEESDIAGFLGIEIKRHDDGTLELLQTGLIGRILRVMKLEDAVSTHTPAAKVALGKDEDGPERNDTWSYSSVVGMMMYLAVNSRPDIAFAVNQCARFTHTPKRCHEVALKKIARYLKGTMDRGMCIKAEENLRLDLYADADFAGLWGAEGPNDPTSVKSRSGNLVTFGGVPIVWLSKLQSEIALSTAESEYISLSTGLRTLLPLRQLLQEVCGFLKIERDKLSLISTVWEDNQATLKMVNAPFPNMTPRTKHIACKYHWFRSHVKDGEIECKYIKSEEQRADIFTKGLVKQDFEEKRKMLMGW
jgi:hypothetical protein